MSATKRRVWPKVLIGLVLLLGIAGVAGLKALDAYLLGQVRAQASKLSFELHRPIKVEGLSTRFLTGFGARVDGVEVGPEGSEGAPLLKIARIEVRAPLLQAIQSKGKDVVVSSAEVEGLVLNVVRLPDGTTNLDALTRALDERAAKQPPAPKDEAGGKTDLSNVRVDRAAVLDGQLHLLDRARGTDLAITKLNAEVNDLRAGKALALKVTAAVLAAAPNFTLTALTTPLDSSLSGVPQKVTVKLTPVDLAPLGGFIPPEVGFQAGRFDLDLTAELGGAVSGGEGPTKVVGTFHGQGLKFAGAEGGKALDTQLEVDLDGDTAKGDLNIRKLTFDFGPAGLRGKGSVQGLLSAAPSVQGLEIVGHDLDPAVLQAYYPPLKKQLNGQVEGPIALTVRGEGSQAAQAIQLDLDFTAVSLAMPKQLSKAKGAPMKVSANVKGGGQAVRFQSTLSLSGLDLRPGGKINKGPGEPLDVALAGTYRPAQGKGGTTRLELSQVNARVLADSFAGKGFVETSPKTTRFDLALKGDRLDYDRLMIKKDEPPKGAAPPKVDQPKKADAYDGLEGHAAVQLGLLKMQQMDMQSVVLDVKVKDDLVTVNTMSLYLYGGQVNASGSTMHLAGDAPPFQLKAKLKDIDAGAVLAKRTPHKILSGKLSSDIDLKGEGLDKVDLSKTLEGLVQGSIADGAFLGADLLGEIVGPLAKQLPFGNQKLSSLSSTSLGAMLPFGVELKDGIAQLKNPISFTRPDAQMKFEGGIHLDGMLNLNGTVALMPQVISAITGGKVVPKAPIPVTLKLGGPAWKPVIRDLDLKPAVQTILAQAGAAAAGRFLGEKGGKVVEDLAQGNAKKAAEEAVERQRKEAEAKAAEAARQEQERLKQKAAGEAGKRLKGIFGGK